MGSRLPLLIPLLLGVSLGTTARAKDWVIDPRFDWGQAVKQLQEGDTLSVLGDSAPPIVLGRDLSKGRSLNRVFLVKDRSPPVLIKIASSKFRSTEAHHLLNEAKDLEFLAKRGFSTPMVVRAQPDGVFLLKRYVPGTTLWDLVAGLRDRPFGERVKLIESAMRFGARLDSAGLLFGDMKGENVLLSGNEWVILDPGGVYEFPPGKKRVALAGAEIAEELYGDPASAAIRVVLATPGGREHVRKIVLEPDPDDPEGNLFELLFGRRKLPELPEGFVPQLIERNADWLSRPVIGMEIRRRMGITEWDLTHLAEFLEGPAKETEKHLLRATLAEYELAFLQSRESATKGPCRPGLRERFRQILGIVKGR